MQFCQRKQEFSNAHEVIVLWQKILNNFKVDEWADELEIEGLNFMSTIERKVSVTC